MSIQIQTIKKLRVTTFALDESVVGEIKIADHINLTGESIKDLGFIPVSDLYLDKENPDAIKVACLKEGVKPTKEEKAKLLEHGIKAYSYELIKPVLEAAKHSRQVEATAVIPKLPKTFSLETRACQIKESGALDFALIKSSKSCIWSGVFTQNKARAFCVERNLDLLKVGEKVKVLACNSGNANACTGELGEQAHWEICTALSENYDANSQEVMLASTGVIGVPLSSAKIIYNLNQEADTSIGAFAQGILTTDTCRKISANKSFMGFAKGSGMINPQMSAPKSATMLAFIITDKKIVDMDEDKTKVFMQKALQEACDKSFNAITVDGDTSTNDSCFLVNSREGEEISKEEFQEDLRQITQDLAYKIVRDGEGVTKLIKLTIKSDLARARDLGKFILNSPLVKTAIHGADPNWGRVISSLGQFAAQEDFDINLSQAQMQIFDTVVFKEGITAEYDKAALSKQMQANFEVEIELSLGGNLTTTVIGNDLSPEYISINADYTT